MLGVPCSATGVIEAPGAAPVPVATPTSGTFITQAADLVAPTSNPCSVNLTNSQLTMHDVREEYPAFRWGNSEPWTAENMQCWAWLATQSGETHPGRTFSKQYGFEPYLILMI